VSDFALSVVVALRIAVAAGPDTSPPPGTETDVERIDVSGYSPERQAAYALLREKCSKCHSLSRGMSTRLTTAQWKRHMKRMAVRANAGISDAQAKTILEFLDFYASQQGAKQAAR
jgi:hypothetical protein